MTNEASAGPERVRTAEVVAALCLATDLAMGFPFEHGLHATRIAARLGDRLAIDPKTASETFYACLLCYCGCTADAEIAAETYDGDLMANLGPALFGSQRELLAGVVRSLPDPESAAPVRAIQIARRLPKAAKGNKPHIDLASAQDGGTLVTFTNEVWPSSRIDALGAPFAKAYLRRNNAKALERLRRLLAQRVPAAA